MKLSIIIIMRIFTHSIIMLINITFIVTNVSKLALSISILNITTRSIMIVSIKELSKTIFSITIKSGTQRNSIK